ncbi:MAG: hypothetical protein EXS10_04350 [Phycisphaerales bacterium]|nr:hypothetical protein [Phycisphaerales bacterium]
MTRWRATLLPIAWILAFGAVVLAVAWSIPKLEARFSEDAIASERTLDLEFLNAPHWFDERCQIELAARVTDALRGTSPFDPQRLTVAAVTIKESGWFLEVRQVQLLASGALEINATYTTPFAMVRAADTEYLVDAAGRRLGMTWIAGTRPATPHYPSIVGTRWAPPDNVGAQWKGGDVMAGLELAKYLANKNWFHQVSAIDVSKFTDERMLSIVAAGGGTVVWGLPPTDHDAAEVMPETKLGYIDHFYSRYGRIDSGAGQLMDLRGDLVTLAGGSPE